MDDFLLRAFVAGFGVALVAGPLGCFIVWRRMAYFGDSLAHSALLGVAMGLVLHIDVTIGIAAMAVVLALLLLLLQQQRRLATDTYLGIMAHSGLALGLVTLSFFETLRVDLMAYLFGDLLAVTGRDLAWILGGGAVALGLLVVIWRPLLAATAHEDLARAEGLPVVTVRLLFVVLIALVIAIAMKVVGILLITSMLIIPPAAARQFATTPEGMALLSVGAGLIAVACGLWGSLLFDTPSGPSIVVGALLVFVFCMAAASLSRRLA